jgi:hypothetical protein
VIGRTGPVPKPGLFIGSPSPNLVRPRAGELACPAKADFVRRSLWFITCLLLAATITPAGADPTTCIVSSDGESTRRVGSCSATLGPGRVEWTVSVPSGTTLGWTVRWRTLDGELLSRDRCDVSSIFLGSRSSSCRGGGGDGSWISGGGGSSTSVGPLGLISMNRRTLIPVKVSLRVRAHKDGQPFVGTIHVSIIERPA